MRVQAQMKAVDNCQFSYGNCGIPPISCFRQVLSRLENVAQFHVYLASAVLYRWLFYHALQKQDMLHSMVFLREAFQQEADEGDTRLLFYLTYDA